MKVEGDTKNASLYTTWYEFKKDLEKRSGRSILNWDWLRVKPKTPLPWTDANMQSALMELKRKDEEKNLHQQTQSIPH